MSFEADLKSHLQASAALAALVGDRITPAVREEGIAPPAVTYVLIAADPIMNLDGMDGALRNFRVQVDAWARAHSDAMAMADAIRARMDVAATTFTSVVLTTLIEDYDPDARLYRRGQEFSCWYSP